MTRLAIETHTGLAFDYADPSSEQVDVADIAHALAHTCRFGGHINHFYSVASHALLVRQLVFDMGHPELGYAAVHHDSHEAYLCDLPKPLKVAMERMGLSGGEYLKLSQRVDAAVGEYLGIDPDDFRHPVIKEADDTALRMEATALKVDGGRSFADLCGVEPLAPIPFPYLHTPVPPTEVKQHFLIAHHAERDQPRPSADPRALVPAVR